MKFKWFLKWIYTHTHIRIELMLRSYIVTASNYLLTFTCCTYFHAISNITSQRNMEKWERVCMFAYRKYCSKTTLVSRCFCRAEICELFNRIVIEHTEIDIQLSFWMNPFLCMETIVQVIISSNCIRVLLDYSNVRIHKMWCIKCACSPWVKRNDGTRNGSYTHTLNCC